MPSKRSPRRLAGRAERVAQQARRDSPHHGGRARSRRDPLAHHGKAGARLSRHHRGEVVVDYGLTDIVAERYDAGIRLGEQVAEEMIAVRIGPDTRMAVVGAPSYFERHPPPRVPQDLTAHDCVNLRTPTHGGLYPWEFDKDGREFKVRVEGQLVFNSSSLILNAALDGLGLAYLPEEQVRP